eukprot:XP_017952248.1 PREDICTED: uncharacterized protein LOC101733956 isoform X3 [Xenopus tropicalis]
MNGLFNTVFFKLLLCTAATFAFSPARSVQGLSQSCWKDCLLQDCQCTIECPNWHFQTNNGILLPNYLQQAKARIYPDLICLLDLKAEVCSIKHTDHHGFINRIPNCPLSMCPTTPAPANTTAVDRNATTVDRNATTADRNTTAYQKATPCKELTTRLIVIVICVIVVAAGIAGVIWLNRRNTILHSRRDQ